MLHFFFDLSNRTRFRGLPNPSARQRLLTLPPTLRHVPVQLCVLPALPLQHEGEHGNLRGSGEGEDFFLCYCTLLLFIKASVVRWLLTYLLCSADAWTRSYSSRTGDGNQGPRAWPHQVSLVALCLLKEQLSVLIFYYLMDNCGMLFCRWKKYEIHDIVIECAKVSLDPKEASCEEGYATMPENFYPQIHLRPQDCTSSPYTDLHSSYGQKSLHTWNFTEPERYWILKNGTLSIFKRKHY